MIVKSFHVDELDPLQMHGKFDFKVWIAVVRDDIKDQNRNLNKKEGKPLLEGIYKWTVYYMVTIHRSCNIHVYQASLFECINVIYCLQK